jgi:hypothetical protein
MPRGKKKEFLDEAPIAKVRRNGADWVENAAKGLARKRLAMLEAKLEALQGEIEETKALI